MMSPGMLAAALALALSVPTQANPVVRAGASAESAGQSAPRAPVSAPALQNPLAGTAPTLSVPGSLPSPSLPTPAVRKQAAIATAQAAPTANAVRPAASGLLGPDGNPLVAPAAHAESRPTAAPTLLGADGRPLGAAAAPGAQTNGRAAIEPTAPSSLDALFDGKAGLPADLARDGLVVNSLFVPGLSRQNPEAFSAARQETRLAVEAAKIVAAKAASARTFQGRAMTLDDPCCGVAAPILGVLLRRADIPIDAVQAEFHTYLLRTVEHELMVVDPTIRQFFGGRRAPAEIPAVFIGTFGELESLFERHASAKSTRYGVARIYRSEAVIKNSLLEEARSLAEAAGAVGRLVSPSEAVDNATYAPLRKALPSGPVNAVAEQSVPSPESGPRSKPSWWTSFKEFLFPPLRPDPAWDAVKAAIGPEVARLRAMPKAERGAYLRGVGIEIVEALKKRHGTEEIGFHYNLHGGRAEQYLAGGGIRATMGDIALQYSMHGDRSYKVYFFRSSNANLYDLLSERHPNLVSSRMGDVLILFRLDSKFMKDALASGLARNSGAISMDFDETRLPGMIGVPKDTFLSDPLTVFYGLKTRVGLGRLSRDEETLAVMRYIEARVGS